MSKRYADSESSSDSEDRRDSDYNRRKGPLLEIKKKKSEPIHHYLERYSKYIDNIPKSEIPSPRCNGSLTLINDNELFLFGGEFYDEKETLLFNDSYIFNIKTEKWLLVKCTNKPKPRCSHQTVLYKNNLYMFGGEFASKNDYLHFNDMWKFNIDEKNWEIIKQKGTIPTPRSGHSMAVWNDYLILYGGFYDTNNEVKYYTDLYMFDVTTCIWENIETINNPPPARSASIFSIHNGLLFLHGGYSKLNEVGITHSDTWTVDLNRMKLDGNKIFWEKRKLGGKIPNAQIGFGYIAKDEIIYIFGGIKDINENLDSIFYNEIFSININKSKCSIVFPSENKELIENLNIEKKDNSIPIERSKSLMAIKDDTIYIFGGIRELKRNDLILSDLWEFKNNKWKCLISCESEINIDDEKESETDNEEFSSQEDDERGQ